MIDKGIFFSCLSTEHATYGDWPCFLIMQNFIPAGYKMIRLPKMSDSFAVIWVTSRGHVIIEKDVVLLTMSDVIGVQEDHPNMYGPKGKVHSLVSKKATK